MAPYGLEDYLPHDCCCQRGHTQSSLPQDELAQQYRALFIQLFLSVRVSISPALAFQTNQSISAERPEGKTTRRAASSSLGLAVLPFLPHRPPRLFLSPFSSSRAPFFCHPCFVLTTFSFPAAPPLYSLPPPSLSASFSSTRFLFSMLPSPSLFPLPPRLTPAGL